MINKYYIVRLTPINSYYFGGEITFGEGVAQNYYVKSNYLPQASSLLGVMRYEVLRQNNLLSYDKNNLAITCMECIIDPEIEQSFAMHTYGINLLYTTITGAQSRCHYKKRWFHHSSPSFFQFILFVNDYPYDISLFLFFVIQDNVLSLYFI